MIKVTSKTIVVLICFPKTFQASASKRKVESSLNKDVNVPKVMQ